MSKLIRLTLYKTQYLLLAGGYLQGEYGRRSHSRRFCRGWIICVTHLLWCASAIGQESALTRKVMVSIHAGPMGPALTMLSTQAGVQIIAASSRVDALVTPGAHGIKTLSEALSELLTGTNLRFYLDGPSTVSVGESRSISSPESSLNTVNPPEAPASEPSAAGSFDQQVKQSDDRGNANMKRKGFLSRLLGVLVVCNAAAIATNPACAQEASPPSDDPEELTELVISGSRVIKNGLAAPTPVTVVSSDTLKDVSPGDRFVGLTQLPVFQGSTSPATATFSTAQSNVGGGFANLRGLDGTRTLVLLNGRRVVASTSTGTPDVSLFPSPLVSRVDVVTGGASAAYGSDAVTGVVNFILDTEFTGLKGEVQGGLTQEGDKKNYMVNGVYGTAFGADNRGHFIVAGEYNTDDGLGACDREFSCEGWAVVNNGTVTAATATEANPLRVVRQNVKSSRMAIGGLIYSGQGVLSNIKFGPGGVPTPFVPGELFNPTTMVGGSGDNGGEYATLYAARDQYNIYSRGSYAISESVNAYVEGSFGHTDIVAPSFLSREGPTAEQFTIFQDNAFLPASIRSTMVANNIASFQMGRIDRDFIREPRNFGESTSPMEYLSENQLARGVAGINGRLGSIWAYDANVSYGRNKVVSNTINNPILENTYLASDAVIDPATGAAACRIKVQNPTSTDPVIRGCQPLNVFGEGSPSSQSLNYILGTSIAERVNTQTAVDVSINGEPFASWAGPVGVAFGGAYRKERLEQDADPISKYIGGPRRSTAVPAGLTGRFGGFRLTNTPALQGEIDVKEAFTEVAVPLAKDARWAESLDLNAAARYAYYSTSGGVTTWKAGAVYSPGAGLRFRATRSRDIRAGNMIELFETGAGSGLTVNDPFRGGVVSSSGQTISRGNIDLQPEEADTTAIGFTYQPSWFDGFSTSVDLYSIDINGAIISLGAQNILNQCFEGAAFLCPLIQRGADGSITFVDNPRVNAASVTARGVDLELGYDTSVVGGTLGLRALTTFTAERETLTPGGTPIDVAGEIISSAPKWRSTLTARYDRGPLTVTLSERYIGSGKFDNQAGPTSLSPSDNHIKAVFYTNLTTRYRVSQLANSELFLSVSNLFDQEPPKIGSYATAGTVVIGKDMYDNIGRAFTVGARFKF